MLKQHNMQTNKQFLGNLIVVNPCCVFNYQRINKFQENTKFNSAITATGFD